MHPEQHSTIEYIKNEEAAGSALNVFPHPLLVGLIRLFMQFAGRIAPRRMGKLALRMFLAPSKKGRKPTQHKPIMQEAQPFMVSHKGGFLKGYAWGGGAETVLLVHGWNSKASHWSGLIPKLVDAGYQVVAFDLPAHGGSDGHTTDLPDTASAISALVDCVGPVSHIVAHSFGGAATSLALTDHGIEVEKLVLMGTPVRLQWVIDHFTSYIRLPKAARRWMETYLELRIGHTIDELDITQSGRQMRADQILVIHDERDETIPVAEALRLVKLDQHPSFLVLEGFGHFGMIKHPVSTRRVVDFLRQSPLKPKRALSY